MNTKTENNERINMQIETIDDFMEWVADNVGSVSIQYTYKQIVTLYDDSLLDMLTSKSNKPSVYDLRIIDAISKVKSLTRFQKEILEIYKNRK